MKIRSLKEEDIEFVYEIEKECFPKGGWTKEQFLYELNENPFANVCVIEDDNHIVGYVDWWITYEQAQLANIAVKVDHRKLGIGQTLLQYVIDDAIMHECENISLEVRVSNQQAIQLYEKNGFINVNIRKSYYDDGENAYLMVKPIGGLS